MKSIELQTINNSSHTFNDGFRSIDYILVWEAKNKDATSDGAYDRRRIFENNLKEVGLQLEEEAPDNLNGLHFVKIHVPLEVIRRFSEVLQIRMPMKVSPLNKSKTSKNVMGVWWDKIISKFSLDTTIYPKKDHRLTAIYSRDKEYLFDTTSEFWSPLVRIRIVQYILNEEKYGNGDMDFGISRLIPNGTYSAAYPLHDGDLKTPGSMRYLLNSHWASLTKCFKFQPLDYLKDYFGVKIGLYFAWLGFYTIMLIPASIVGLFCVVYSLATMFFDKPSADICNYNSSIRMCPTCDNCDYWDLRDKCLKSRIAYLFDNPTTVFFAVFMSFWAVCFLELWKRYSAEMSYRWDLTGFDLYQEHPRPQFMAKKDSFKKLELNVVTGKYEPVVPFWKIRVPVVIMSTSILTLLILLVISSVLAVVCYRISLLGASVFKNKEEVMPKMFNAITAPLINLVFILILGFAYKNIARWLTEREMLRTQKEFEDSLTLKIFILQFINFYSSIFYIAFFEGKFVGQPGNYSRLFGYRLKECSPGGCLIQLSIQLATIMIGKQFIGAIKEMMQPFLIMWWKTLRTMGRKKSLNSPVQWVQDFKLVDIGDMGLFPEYLEMVIQFGFITIFVSAFPLAPLFALINNVLEMRLDAKKFVRYYRRTVLQRVNDIGVWYRILDSIGKLSVITNDPRTLDALLYFNLMYVYVRQIRTFQVLWTLSHWGIIIAFTSEFIPRLLYTFKHGDLDNYVEFTLRRFNTTVLAHPPVHSNYNQSHCSYLSYSYSEPSDDYEQKWWYWQVMSARLIFVLIFENVVTLAMIFIRWAIPDMPRHLRYQIRREAYVTKNLILEQSRSGSRDPNLC